MLYGTVNILLPVKATFQMGSDKAIVKAKTDSIIRDSFLEVITGVNIDKVVAAKKRKAAAKAATKAATKAASQYGALAQAAFPPPWASPPPHLHQNAWPMYPPVSSLSLQRSSSR